MKEITTEDVKRIAALARLGLTESEVVAATRDVKNILNHFSQIQTVSTEQVSETADISGLKNVMREDNAQANTVGSAEALLAQAPMTHKGHIQVQAVFTNNES